MSNRTVILSNRTVILSIDYDEFRPGTYRATEMNLFLGGQPLAHRRFATGDPEADYLSALDTAAELQAASGASVMVSSSVDSFISDDPVAAAGVASLRR